MYKQPLFIKNLKSKSRNSDAFSAEVPRLKPAGLPGTL